MHSAFPLHRIHAICLGLAIGMMPLICLWTIMDMGDIIPWAGAIMATLWTIQGILHVRGMPQHDTLSRFTRWRVAVTPLVCLIVVLSSIRHITYIGYMSSPDAMRQYGHITIIAICYACSFLPAMMRQVQVTRAMLVLYTIIYLMVGGGILYALAHTHPGP